MENLKGAMECLRHFARRRWPPKGNKDADKAKAPLADFIGIKTDSLRRWLTGRAKPIGLQLTRLALAMESVGYAVAELHEIHEESRMLTELLSFRIISMNDALALLELKRVQSALDVAHGKNRTTPEKLAKLAVLYLSRKTEIEMARKNLAASLGTPQVLHTESQGHVKKSSAVSETELQALALNIVTLKDLLAHVARDSMPGQRRAFRELVGNQTMFEFTNAVIKLSSERAREIRELGD